jgi:cold shock CspA family protein
MHVPIVKRFQVYLESTKTVDASSNEGKSLISKYNITAVPTILITGDVSVYDPLAAIWPSVGSVEEDGVYVFRTMSAVRGSVYKDLSTGQVVTPQQPTQQPASGSHTRGG